MPENNINFVQPTSGETRGCGCNSDCGCGNNNGFLGNLCCDSEILFFIIIFLLLFTNFGCGCCRG